MDKSTYYKQWYEANKDHVHQRSCEKVLCDCGIAVSRSNLRKHKKTFKHQQILDIKNSIIRQSLCIH